MAHGPHQGPRQGSKNPRAQQGPVTGCQGPFAKKKKMESGKGQNTKYFETKIFFLDHQNLSFFFLSILQSKKKSVAKYFSQQSFFVFK